MLVHFLLVVFGCGREWVSKQHGQLNSWQLLGCCWPAVEVRLAFESVWISKLCKVCITWWSVGILCRFRITARLAKAELALVASPQGLGRGTQGKRIFTAPGLQKSFQARGLRAGSSLMQWMESTFADQDLLPSSRAKIKTVWFSISTDTTQATPQGAVHK